MKTEKQEELKKLLVSADSNAENYDKCSMQELIALKNSAAATKEKNWKDKKTALFFAGREEFFRFTVLRRLQKADHIYVAFAKATNLPYVVCDEDTCNDQIFLFSEETFVQAYVQKAREQSRQLLAVKLEEKQFLQFYVNLYAMGVNELVIDRGANSLAVPLDKLVKKPDYANAPKGAQPVVNSELFLTALYFTQECALPKEQRRNGYLRELEEEMLADLSRGRLLLPLQAPEGGRVSPKDLKLAVVKMENGDIFQPVCTDGAELQKFIKGKNLKAIPIDCAKLQGFLNKETKGIILNPASLRIVIRREKLG